MEIEFLGYSSGQKKVWTRSFESNPENVLYLILVEVKGISTYKRATILCALLYVIYTSFKKARQTSKAAREQCRELLSTLAISSNHALLCSWL